jgi:DNA-binding HxlR family transcriptional regulator
MRLKFALRPERRKRALFGGVGTKLCSDESPTWYDYDGRMRRKHLTVSERATYRSLEDVIGCKWPAAIVVALGRGVHRPGRLERFIPGISTKVLTERLRKMLAYGLITRTEYAGLPARVEYHLTPIGQKLASVIEQLRAVEAELSCSRTNTPPDPGAAANRARSGQSDGSAKHQSDAWSRSASPAAVGGLRRSV